MSETKKVGIIYSIKNNINNKLYIGSTINHYKRWKEHLCLLKNNKHHSSLLQNAWNKYGEENFEFTILEENVNEEILLQIEQSYIEKYKTYERLFGYNVAKNTFAIFKGRNHTEETKKVQSEKNSGHNHWAYGKHLSDEHKNLISSRKRKIPKSLEQEIIEKYNNIKNAYIIAEQYYVHAETIYRILRRNGIKRKINARQRS